MFLLYLLTKHAKKTSHLRKPRFRKLFRPKWEVFYVFPDLKEKTVALFRKADDAVGEAEFQNWHKKVMEEEPDTGEFSVRRINEHNT